MHYEITFADDDSNDGTDEEVSSLSQKFPVRLMSRKGKEPDLSEAVLDGLYSIQEGIAVVMDADLSHPSDAIPGIVKLLEVSGADFVVGSRYVEGGAIDTRWNFLRLLNSKLATLMVQPLVQITDPMSGFFGLRIADLPDRKTLRPIGYKIGLELMVRGQFNNIREVPILFRDRFAGESKLNLKQQLKYLLHLRRLYLFKYRGPGELLNFLAVGASGFIIDVSTFLILQFFGVEHRIARAISFWPAVTSNWFLNRKTTFEQRNLRPKFRQWVEFSLSSLLGFSISWGTYFMLTTYIPFFDGNRLLSLFLGTGIGAMSNFLVASLYVYSDKRKGSLK
jgi:dolichol-phosphate mannosyltransferase